MTPALPDPDICTCGNPSGRILTCYPPKCGSCRKFLYKLKTVRASDVAPEKAVKVEAVMAKVSAVLATKTKEELLARIAEATPAEPSLETPETDALKRSWNTRALHPIKRAEEGIEMCFQQESRAVRAEREIAAWKAATGEDDPETAKDKMREIASLVRSFESRIEALAAKEARHE